MEHLKTIKFDFDYLIGTKLADSESERNLVEIKTVFIVHLERADSLRAHIF
jgi:hypothetical protein